PAVDRIRLRRASDVSLDEPPDRVERAAHLAVRGIPRSPHTRARPARTRGGSCSIEPRCHPGHLAYACSGARNLWLAWRGPRGFRSLRWRAECLVRERAREPQADEGEQRRNEQRALERRDLGFA